ncbi:hypothetical protein [Hymenobacter sp. APR13]|uniref:hypothetical protein n=1 Tax=Hymenobacter sp. APR13 TaxID=1356852 RepID=UPI0012E08F7E|nr:hypothetical protein [Hymenobacter sp. APR13]
MARAQQHQLFASELESIVVITLHSTTQTLTVAVERPDETQVVDTLREALCYRRQALKTEARQLRQDY